MIKIDMDHPLKIKAFTARRAEELSATALRIFADHGSHRRYEREHCAACALLKFNYAGWLPLYIAARRPVPGKKYVAEIESARAENPFYYRSILAHIATYGISVV